MVTQEANRRMPPLLSHGGCIEFVDLGHLLSVKESELGGWVTVIDRAGVTVGDRLDVHFRVGQQTAGASFEAHVVYFEGGVAGLAVELTEQALDSVVEACTSKTPPMANIAADKAASGTRPQRGEAGPQMPSSTVRQGWLRPAKTAADELLKREQATLFSLLRDLQFEGQVGRLTLVSSSINWQFELSQQATMQDFSIIDPRPFVEEGLIPNEALDRLPKTTLLSEIYTGFGLDSVKGSVDAKRAFNRASFTALKATLRQLEKVVVFVGSLKRAVTAYLSGTVFRSCFMERTG